MRPQDKLRREPHFRRGEDAFFFANAPEDALARQALGLSRLLAREARERTTGLNAWMSWSCSRSCGLLSYALNLVFDVPALHFSEVQSTQKQCPVSGQRCPGIG